MAVDVDLPNVFAIHKKRNDNFWFYGETARNIIVLGRHIGNHEIGIGNRYLSTNSFSERNYGMIRFCPNIRAKMQGFGLVIGKIKTNPIIVINGVAQ